MNETEKYRLLRLYKLLWEQIKYEQTIISIRFHIRMLRGKMLISLEEMVILDKHLFENKPQEQCSKSFVQRMIKELES